MLQQTNGKLRTYITFKSNFGREKYLSVLKKSFEQRRCLTELRISCHQLKIETGRYQGTLLHDRKCERCSSGEVEDEYHFLIHCNKLENDRNLLLKEIVKSCPNFKRLNSKNKLVLVNEYRGKISLHYYSNIYSKKHEITWLSFLLWTRGGLHITVP
jgi:phage terminase large subunit-like protein